MRFRLFACLVVSILFASQNSNGDEKPAVNSKAPGFSLQDQNGKQISIDNLLKDRNVALVFHRSADW
ncbi:MAG: hypothetical protein H8E66_11375 [Planctomycetes bacterium]|nr:hypothetical protein [Planctomycetota bacterium]